MDLLQLVPTLNYQTETFHMISFILPFLCIGSRGCQELVFQRVLDASHGTLVCLFRTNQANFLFYTLQVSKQDFGLLVAFQ
jgi:hypothetical protein